MHVVDGQAGETLTEASARRLRGMLAEKRMSGRQVALRLGKSHAWIQRRLTGDVSMTIEDMEHIESVTGISAIYLITGMNAESRRPAVLDGGSSGVVHPPGLEPGTH